MDLDGVEELEVDEEEVPPLRNIQHFRQQVPSTGQLRAAFARQPAAAPPGVPGPRPAPVRLVPEGWPNLRQQQTASASQRPVKSTCSAQLPAQHAQAPQHQPQAKRLVLMPSLIQPHSNVQQGSMQPPVSKRPAGQLSAPVTKRMMQLAPPAQSPSAAQPAAAATPSMQAQQRSLLSMQAHSAPAPLLLEAGSAQPQVHLGGITIPGPAGALQRRMQQGLVQTGPSTGLSGPPRVMLPSQASEPDPAFSTPQWMAAVHACSRLEGVQQGLQGLEEVMQPEERAGKVARLAACMVSMSLTGNGDAFARLKDPAHAVGAGICQKALQAHPQITKPGTAIVLRDVTYLKMSNVPYLCITLPNIVKVFS